MQTKEKAEKLHNFLHNILHNKLHNFDTARTGRKDKAMKKRNTVTIIEGTKVSPYYDIDLADIAEILEISKGNENLAVAHAFIYGYAMGQRATTAEQRRTAKG